MSTIPPAEVVFFRPGVLEGVALLALDACVAGPETYRWPFEIDSGFLILLYRPRSHMLVDRLPPTE
jgi:hypothetical protein